MDVCNHFTQNDLELKTAHMLQPQGNGYTEYGGIQQPNTEAYTKSFNKSPWN